MARPEAQASPTCRRELHDQCPHKNGGGVEGSFRRSVHIALLCNCSCHSACPVGGESSVPNERWNQECTCPGSAAWREREPQLRAERKEFSQRMRAAFADADIRPGDRADVVRTKLTRAAETHNIPMDSDLTRISRLIAAAQARRGTRTMRFLVEGAKGLRAARRRGPPPASDSPNGREIKHQRAVLARIWVAAAVALGLTRVLRGAPRIVSAAAAGFLAALGAVFGLMTYLMSSLARAFPEDRTVDRPR